jgi:predicted Zn-dependent protease
VAASHKRSTVIRFSGILMLVSALVVTLALLFNYQNRIKQLVRSEQADLISVVYLRVLVHMQPQDGDLRVELAEKLADLGRWDEARAALQPLLGDDAAENWPVRLLDLEIGRRKLYSLEHDNPEHQAVLKELADELETLVGSTIPDTYLERIAQLALEVNRPDIASGLYDQLALTDTERRAQWLAMAARWRLATGDPLRAGQAYNEASLISSDREASQRYALLSLQAFRGANDGAHALSLAEVYLTRFPNNRTMLDSAIDIARAQENQRQAMEWGYRRLALDPTNTIELERQFKLALEAGALSDALELAAKLVDQHPEDSEARRRLAQTAEWAGHPRRALAQWRWLAQHSAEGAADHALAMARGLQDDDARIAMLAVIAQQRQLEDGEVREMADAYRRLDQLRTGAGFFKTYLKQYPSHLSGWTALAQLQEENGDLLDAASTWDRIGTSFRQPVEAACSRAELLRRLDMQDDALRLLLAVQDRADDDNVRYWRLLGAQAWDLENTTPALTAHRKLWQEGAADALEAERLVILERDAGAWKEAVSVAEQAAERYDIPRLLLLATDAAIQAQAWDEAEHVLIAASSKPGFFDHNETYWLQRALVAVHGEQHEAAKTCYEQALQLNPRSVPARVGMLWLLIETNNTRLLPAYLQRWEADAIKEPAFWGAYAIALSKLGQNKRALPWYRRQAQANPQDSALLLSYSQTLDQTGNTEAAWRLRRHVLQQLRSVTPNGGLAKADTP